MKIHSAKYDGLDDPFTRVKVEVTLAGKRQEGVLLFENDGRDMETEGLDFETVVDELDALYEDEESMKLLEAELEKGSKEYYQVC